MRQRSETESRLGHRWGVYVHYEGPFEPDADGVYRFDGQTPPSSYGVRDVFDGENEREFRFKSEAAAKRKADELNRFDVQGPLDPAFKERRQRLKRWAPDFGSWMHEGPPEARWPVRPERYLIQGHDDGWHGEAWDELVDTLEGVQEVLEGDTGHEVLRVIDLDTSSEVQYNRQVSVDLGESA